MARLAALLLVALYFSPLVLALAAGAEDSDGGYVWVRTVSMEVPAVARTETGFVGVMSRLTVSVAWPGSGVVYVSADPLTELDMQAAARIAAFVASLLAGYDFEHFDFFVRVESDSPIVGGPSASAAMAVSFLAAFRGKSIPGNFSMTGMIDPDTTIGPVGGVPEKLTAAARSGVKVFAVPPGQTVALSLSTGSNVNVTELGRELGVRVVEADTVLDAYALATGDRGLLEEYTRGKTTMASRGYPEWLADSLRKSAEFFRRQAASNTSCAEDLVERLPSGAAGLVASLLNTSKTLLGEGDEYAGRGLYYAAASRYFGAAIAATEACILARSIASNDLRGLLSEAEKLVDVANRTLGYAETAVRGRLAGAGNLTDLRLQLAIAVLTRTSDARGSARHAAAIIRGVESGELPPTLDVLSRLVDDAVYAYYRSLTAKQWLEVFKKASGGHVIPWERLRRSIESYVYFAYSEASYANALGVTSSEGQQYVEAAKELLASANTTVDYIVALMNAVRGYTAYTTALWAAFNTGEAAVRAAGKGLTVLVNMAKERGLTPLLPLLYSEYASVLEEPAARLGILVQGSSYALLLNMLARAREKPAGIEESGRTVTVTATATVTVTREETVTREVTVTITPPGGTATTIVTTVPVNVTVTATVPVTVTHKVAAGTVTVTETRTVTRTVAGGSTASFAAIVLTAAIALAAGTIAARASGRRGA